MKHKITPFIWFNNQAEEAIEFYFSIFTNHHMIFEQRHPDGKLFTAEIELEGNRIKLINGGPMYQLNEAFSLFISCENQEEVDYYWEKLSKNGVEQPCCWLKDQFGLSWQVVPKDLGTYLYHEDAEKRNKLMQAFMQMKKVDIKTLKQIANS